MPQLGAYREIVKQTFCGIPIASTVVPVSDEEVEQARVEFQKTGVCQCELVIDIDCWMYSIRQCAVCGKGLGLI